MMSQPGEQTVAIHLLPSISKTKGKQAIRFGQLIEHEMRKFLLKKLHTKCEGETFQTLF